MKSFPGIGLSGSASLAVVAPGISEALVATAAGLAAAIPAVIAFNYFMNKIRIVETELHSFSADFLNIIERDILRPGEEKDMMTGGNKDGFMADINVTPLVDVMLVLLIIFMVTAPMMMQGMDVALPQVTSKSLEAKEEQLMITIRKDDQIFINDFPVTIDTV